MKRWARHAINARLRGNVTWDDMQLSLSSARILAPRIVDDMGQTVLHATEVRLTYSPWRMLLRASFVQALDEVVVEQPRVDVRMRPDGTLNVLSLLRPAPPNAPSFAELFRGVLTVHRGDLTYDDAPSIAPLDRIEARVDMRGARRATAHLSCREADASCSFDAAWQENLRNLTLDVTMSDFDLASWGEEALRRWRDRLPTWARVHLRGGRARLEAHVRAFGPPKWPDTVDVTGRVTIADLAGRTEAGVPLREGRLSAVMARDLIDIQRFTVELGNDTIDAAGRVYNLRAPQIDMAVQARSRDVARTLRHFGVAPKVAVRGRGILTLRFLGPWVGAPRIRAGFSSPSLSIGGHPLRAVDACLDGENGSWHVERLRARSQGGSVQASGWIFLRDGHMLLDIRTRDALLRGVVGAFAGTRARATAELTLLGTRQRPLVIGRASVDALTIPGVPLSRVDGNFIYHGDGVMFSGVRASAAGGTVEAPVGYLTLGGRHEFFAAVHGRDMALDTAGGRVRGGRMALLVSGTRGRLGAIGRVEAATVSAGRLTVNDLSATVAFSPDTVFLGDAKFGWGRSRIFANGALSRRRNTFELSAATTAGRYDVSGEFGRGGMRGVAFMQDADVRLLNSLGVSRWRPEGRMDAEVLFASAGRALDVDLVGRSSRMWALGVPFDRVRYSSSSGHGADIHDLTLMGPSALVSLNGYVPPQGGQWRMDWMADVTNLRRVVHDLRLGVHPAALHRTLARLRVDTLSGHAFASGTVRGSKAAPMVAGRVQVDRAHLHGDTFRGQVFFQLRQGLLTLSRGSLTLGGDPVSIGGRIHVSAHGPLDLYVRTPFLNLERALRFTPSRGVATTGWVDAAVRVSRPSRGLTVGGFVHLHDARVAGQRIDDARISLRASGHGDILIQQLQARVGSGTVAGHGALNLSGPLLLDVTARQFPLGELRFLRGTPLEPGVGNFTAHIGGVMARPNVSAQFDVGGFRMTGGGPPISLAGEFAWAAPRLTLRGVGMSGIHRGTSTTVSGYIDFVRGALPRTFDQFLAGSGELTVTLSNANAASLFALAQRPGKDVSGRLNGTLSVAGRLSAPLLRASLSGTSLRMAGVDVGTLHASASYDAAAGEFGDFDLTTNGGGGTLQIVARPAAEPADADRQWLVRADAFDIASLQPLVPWRYPFGGRLDAALDIAGSLRNPDVGGDFRLVDGRVGIASFDAFSGSISARHGVYNLNHFVLSKGTSHATLDGVVPLVYQDGHYTSPSPIDVTARVQEPDLNILSLFIPDMLPSSGVLRANVNITGRYPDVEWDGSLSIANGNFQHRALRQPLENLQVAATVKGNQVKINRFRGTLGKGAFTISGGANVSGLSLHAMDFHLLGKELSLVVPPYLNAVLDADLHLRGSSASAARSAAVLEGTVNARTAHVTVPLKDIAGLAGAPQPTPEVKPWRGLFASPTPAPSPFTAPSATAPSTAAADAVPPFRPPPRRTPIPVPTIALDLRVNLGQDAWLSMLGNTVRGEGQLTFVGEGGDVRPRGVVALKQGQIQVPVFPVFMRLMHGKASFTAHGGWIPEVEASAVTTVGQYDVYVDVRGPANDPRVALSSNPPMSQTAIRELLLGGVPRPSTVGLNNPAVIAGPNGTMWGAYNPVGFGALVNVAQATVLRPVAGVIGQFFGVSEVTFEFPQTGGIQYTLNKAIDPWQKFYLTVSSLQGNNPYNLPRTVYGIEFRFAPTQLVRISTDDVGGQHIYYQTRWRF